MREVRPVRITTAARIVVTAIAASVIFLQQGFAQEGRVPTSPKRPLTVLDGISVWGYETAAGGLDSQRATFELATGARREPFGVRTFPAVGAVAAEGGGADVSEMVITQLHYVDFDCDDARALAFDAACAGDCNVIEVLWTETVAHEQVEIFVDDGAEAVAVVPGIPQADIDAGITINGANLVLDAGLHRIRIEELDGGTFEERDFEVLDAPPGFSAIHGLGCHQGISAGDGSCEIRIDMTANAGADFYHFVLNGIEQPADIPFGLPVVTFIGAPSNEYTLLAIPFVQARDADGVPIAGSFYAGCATDGGACTLDCATEPCIEVQALDVCQDGYPDDGATASLFAQWVNGPAPRDTDGDGTADVGPYPSGVRIFLDGSADPVATVAQSVIGFPGFFGAAPLALGDHVLGAEGACDVAIFAALVERELEIVQANPHAGAVDGIIAAIFDEGDPAVANDQSTRLFWTNGEPSAYFNTLLFRENDPANPADDQLFIIPVAGSNLKFPGDIFDVTFTGPILETDIFILEFYAYDDDTGSCYSSTFQISEVATDSDGDGLFDFEDNCPGDANETQDDFDVDSVGDLCDNCPDDPNTDQADEDDDGIGDVCDRASIRFIRGICANNSPTPQLTDAVFFLNFLFLGGGAPTCSIACDTDGNGRGELTDAVSVLNFLFLGGPAPATWGGNVPRCEDFAPGAPGFALGCAQGHPSC